MPKFPTFVWQKPVPPRELEIERLKWIDVPLDTEELEKFYLSDPALSLIQDHRLQIRTIVWLEHGIGFPEQAAVKPFGKWLAERAAAKHFRFDSDGRIKLTIGMNFYLLWRECSAWEKERGANGLRGDNGWWKHGVKLMARFQYWKLFGRDNWTSDYGNTPEKRQEQRDLRDNPTWKSSCLVFASGKLQEVLAKGRESSYGKGDDDEGSSLRQSTIAFGGKQQRAEDEEQAAREAKRQRREEERAAAREAKRQREEEEEAAREAERELRRQKKRMTREKNVSTKNVNTKRVKDEQTEEPENQKHNTVYLFRVIPEVTRNAPGAVRFSVENGWFEKEFSDKTSAKMGVTGKEMPTERERSLNDKFGVTHVLDQYVHLRDDVKKEDVEKLLFENVKVKGACHLEPLSPSTEHFFFKHDAEEGFVDDKAMKLFRTVFFDTVRPYVDFEGEEKRLSSADAESVVYDSP